ncbi:hypothetical protein RJT34_15306 [Clitoria ternatea]|uniref:Uncharacterized protein n=1 Tax=Clitoria ternatea TaxID=43366 RepID=A0AAN9PN27_CLITE
MSSFLLLSDRASNFPNTVSSNLTFSTFFSPFPFSSFLSPPNINISNHGNCYYTLSLTSFPSLPPTSI